MDGGLWSETGESGVCSISRPKAMTVPCLMQNSSELVCSFSRQAKVTSQLWSGTSGSVWSESDLPLLLLQKVSVMTDDPTNCLKRMSDLPALLSMTHL